MRRQLPQPERESTEQTGENIILQQPPPVTITPYVYSDLPDPLCPPRLTEQQIHANITALQQETREEVELTDTLSPEIQIAHSEAREAIMANFTLTQLTVLQQLVNQYCGLALRQLSQRTKRSQETVAKIIAKINQTAELEMSPFRVTIRNGIVILTTDDSKVSAIQLSKRPTEHLFFEKDLMKVYEKMRVAISSDFAEIISPYGKPETLAEEWLKKASIDPAYFYRQLETQTPENKKRIFQSIQEYLKTHPQITMTISPDNETVVFYATRVATTRRVTKRMQAIQAEAQRFSIESNDIAVKFLAEKWWGATTKEFKNHLAAYGIKVRLIADTIGEINLKLFNEPFEIQLRGDRVLIVPKEGLIQLPIKHHITVYR